jgi:hypothetical protein
MLARRDFLKLSAATPLLLSGLSFAADDTLTLKIARGSLNVNGNAAGNALQSGDTVTTEEQAAVVVVGKDAYKIGANSQIEIKRDDSGGILKIIAGSLLAVFNKADKKLVTPTATIGIRGTGIYLDVGKDTTYFCNCFGTTELTPQGGESRVIEATHHLATVISHSAEPVLSSGAMAGHSDAELRELAALAGVRLSQDFE